jgi:hypothetical protein
MANKIIYFTAKNSGCKPCEELGKLIEAGKFQSPDGEVDFVDIMTDEGFKRFSDEILSKDDGGVPSAYLNGKKCQLFVQDEIVYFECPSNDQPSSPDEKSSPGETAASHDASLSSPL